MSSELPLGSDHARRVHVVRGREPAAPAGPPAPVSRTPREATLSLTATPSACRDARRWAEVVLHRLGVRSFAARDDVALVVSELVSNAVQHGAAPVVVTLSEAADDLVVSVSDSGSAPYVFGVVPFDPHASHGRGLAVVAALSASWGITPGHPGPGKTVWCRLGGAVARHAA